MIKNITLGGGCFWGVQAAFDLLAGVTKSDVGYCGGTTNDPTYEEVCRKNTGHIEVVKLEFNSDILSLDDILKLFFLIHDPTQTDGQANDIGPQYMSAIFYSEETDKEQISNFIADLSTRTENKIITQLEKLEVFYSAEEYHQKYLDKNPTGYCHINLLSVKKFLEKSNYRLK